MSDRDPRDLERLEELLAEEATDGLGPADRVELESLLAEVDLDDPQGFERAAAALDLVFVARSGAADEPLPAELAARIERDAHRWLPAAAGAQAGPGSVVAGGPRATATGSRPVEAVRRRPTLVTTGGWLAAAAAAVALFVLTGDAERRREALVDELARLELRAEQSRSALSELNADLVAERARAAEARRALDQARLAAAELESALAVARTEAEARSADLAQLVAAAERREEVLLDQVAELEALVYQPPPEVRLERLLARADDVVRVPWNTTPDPLVEGSGVSGEVIWSDSLQEGYMVFEAMRSNRELDQQFQLWIFSANQSPETPVDGGVFDVDATARRLVVPIDPKLAVQDPSLFAVTLEKPGGVVVSSRERLLLLAEV